MKSLFVFILLALWGLTACTQKVSDSICGFYIGEKYSDYVIISKSHDSLFFDGHYNGKECFGSNLKTIRNKVIYTGENGGQSFPLSLSIDNKTLSFSGLSFKRVTPADSVHSYADSMFFYAGAWYITAGQSPKAGLRKEPFFRTSIYFLKKSIALYSNKLHPYLNLGIAYYCLQMADSAKLYWDMGKKIDPTDKNWSIYDKPLGNLYYRLALMENANKNLQGAIELMQRGTAADSTSEELWYNLGGALFTAKRYLEAMHAWQKTLQINPANENAQRGISAIPEEDK